MDNDKKFVNVGTKLPPDVAQTLVRVAESRGMKIYELLQLVCWVLVRATSDKHNLSEEINQLLIMFHNEAGWKDAFNLCNPTADNEIAEEILILEQEGKKGFGAVMIQKPFMGEWTQTENAELICNRVLEVCMPGVYTRIRKLIGSMKYNSLTELLIKLTDAQIILDLEEENRREMEAANNIADNGRAYNYGQRTRIKHHRTVDGEAARQQRIMFDDIDRETADNEVQEWEGEHRETDEPRDFKPFTSEW